MIAYYPKSSQATSVRYRNLALLEERDEEAPGRYRSLYRTGACPKPRKSRQKFFVEMDKQLDKLKDLKFGWDGYDAEPPNDTSFAWARKILGALMEFNLEPSRIAASVEGGIGFIFACQDRYADIECLNSGALVAVMYDSQSEPAVWRVSTDSQSIKEALETIRAFLMAPTRLAATDR